MVAASGETEGLRPVVAWALLAGVIVSVTAVILLSAQTMLYRHVPLDKPPEALAEHARDILQSVGYSEPPVDTAMGFPHIPTPPDYDCELFLTKRYTIIPLGIKDRSGHYPSRGRLDPQTTACP